MFGVILFFRCLLDKFRGLPRLDVLRGLSSSIGKADLEFVAVYTVVGYLDV